MADYQKKIKAELEQVAQAIAKLPSCPLSELNHLELSGVGGILQSFINVPKFVDFLLSSQRLGLREAR